MFGLDWGFQKYFLRSGNDPFLKTANNFHWIFTIKCKSSMRGKLMIMKAVAKVVLELKWMNEQSSLIITKFLLLNTHTHIAEHQSSLMSVNEWIFVCFILRGRERELTAPQASLSMYAQLLSSLIITFAHASLLKHFRLPITLSSSSSTRRLSPAKCLYLPSQLSISLSLSSDT